MKQVGVFGASGMLGAYVEEHFKKIGYDAKSFTRADVMTDSFALKEKIKIALSQPSWIINCVGVIKPQIALQGTSETIRVNSLFPHVLSAVGKDLGHTVLHITTDCVFSGREGEYTEKSAHDEQDIYGRTKSLGEPEDCMVVRTSIIGEEKVNKRSLIEWAKSQAGKDVKGYTNHTWNGVTCLQFAKLVEQFIAKNTSWLGVRHVFSPTSVNKFELMSLINEAFDLNLKIEAFAPPAACYRTLSTVHPEIVKECRVPELKDQLFELRKFR